MTNFGSDEQLEWIIDDLEAHKEAIFTIVSHHLPVYDASPSGSTGMVYLQEVLLPIYEEYGVDLVFNGDVHNYQRHFKNGIHYIISAGGGEKPYDYGVPLPGMTLQLCKTYNFVHCSVEGEYLRIITYDHEGKIIDTVEVIADNPPEIYSRIVVETNLAGVARGERFSVNFSIQNANNLDKVMLTLPYLKDEPPLALKVIDADPAYGGVQLERGDLGGDVRHNEADNKSGILEYREESLLGLSTHMVRIASATFEVPLDASITAIYLVPKCIFFDTSGQEIPHFMGGAKVSITK